MKKEEMLNAILDAGIVPVIDIIVLMDFIFLLLLYSSGILCTFCIAGSAASRV
jgi:hypothetical protein